MNWIDIVLLLMLLAAAIIGSKKGLVREVSALITFLLAGVFSVVYIDKFGMWVYEKVGGSPLISAFISFALLLAISYTVFKLLGLFFYKVASIKGFGKQDQMGGALVGFLRGYFAVGFLVFLAFLLPMPDKFYTAFESSMFGPVVAKTVPLVYEGTSIMHPNSPNFIEKIETTLLSSPSDNQTDDGSVSENRQEVYRAMYQLDKFFRLGETSDQI